MSVRAKLKGSNADSQPALEEMGVHRTKAVGASEERLRHHLGNDLDIEGLSKSMSMFP